MGRLSDFIDKETEKRNRRTNEKLQPFMQQMDAYIKAKEQQEVQEQTDKFYTAEHEKYGSIYDKTIPKERQEGMLKESRESFEDMKYLIGMNQATEKDYEGKTVEERRAINKIKIGQSKIKPTVTKGTYYDRETGEKLSVTIKDNVIADNFGRTYDTETFSAKFTETLPTKKKAEAKTTTKTSKTFTNKLINVGGLNIAKKVLGRELTEEDSKTIWSRIQASPESWVKIDGQLKKGTADEQFKELIKGVKESDLTKDVGKDIKPLKAKLAKEKKKKGAGEGKYDKTRVATLESEIEKLERIKAIQSLFGGLEDKSVEVKDELKVGTIDGGYRYLGGNKALESSWEKVQ